MCSFWGKGSYQNDNQHKISFLVIYYLTIFRKNIFALFSTLTPKAAILNIPFSRSCTHYQYVYPTFSAWWVLLLVWWVAKYFFMGLIVKARTKKKIIKKIENEVIGNKGKGRIWKRVFQENKAHQSTCAYQGVRNFHFSENLACFVFLKHPFWDLPFSLITDEVCTGYIYLSKTPTKPTKT